MMRRKLARLPAPAKLNLMLRIVGRRPDGYHLLQTVFQFIDRCDWVTLRVREDSEIRLMNPLPGVPEQQDLTVRAAHLLQQRAGCAEGVDITVEKILPMGGGLGGGSSDAATVLAGLNRLWGCHVAAADLSALGLSLGADVPIFLYGRSAWGEGVGEHLTPLDLAEPWYVVIMPPCQVSTAQIFNSEGLTRNNEPITIESFIAGRHENHCLRVVTQRYPVIEDAVAALGRVSEEPRLTGTGACVFAAFDDADRARTAVELLRPEWDCFLARGCNRSPLLDALETAIS
ncbi:MAG: 4-(cytidine 5'-diphospho)-2-C-methyl-D-erythritol kinase [Methylotetracoccus sp.]|jgi:4-diphosphocytidyl-2-C-methyl-D-erythritol kinase|nr:4-(cytidine 5'-diphospho)-2-C-methyl-D-erythritol kinase [Methylotetracoccus sp.]